MNLAFCYLGELYVLDIRSDTFCSEFMWRKLEVTKGQGAYFTSSFSPSTNQPNANQAEARIIIKGVNDKQLKSKSEPPIAGNSCKQKPRNEVEENQEKSNVVELKTAPHECEFLICEQTEEYKSDTDEIKILPHENETIVFKEDLSPGNQRLPIPHASLIVVPIPSDLGRAPSKGYMEHMIPNLISAPPPTYPNQTKEGSYMLRRCKYWGRHICILCYKGTTDFPNPPPIVAIINYQALTSKSFIPPGGHFDQRMSSRVVTESELCTWWETFLKRTVKSLQGGTPEDTHLYDKILDYNHVMVLRGLIPSNLESGVFREKDESGSFMEAHKGTFQLYPKLSIPVRHGWLVDPEDPEVFEAISSTNKNELQASLANAWKDSTDKDNLTHYGLRKLYAEIKEGDYCLLYRFGYLSLTFHYLGTLYVLENEGDTFSNDHMWKTLEVTEGQGALFTSSFRPTTNQLNATPEDSVIIKGVEDRKRRNGRCFLDDENELVESKSERPKTGTTCKQKPRNEVEENHEKSNDVELKIAPRECEVLISEQADEYKRDTDEIKILPHEKETLISQQREESKGNDDEIGIPPRENGRALEATLEVAVRMT